MDTLLTRPPHRPGSLELFGAAPSDEVDRFLEALHAGRMGPRLQQALGGGPSTCHVLDAKYEPGIRAIVLYEHGGELLRGDLVSESDHSGTDDLVAPGVRLSRFPHDPEMPTLPSVMDPAQLGPALAAGVGRASSGAAGARCRLRLLRYRPGKRATVLVAFSGSGRRYVVKAYHDPAKAVAVVREAPALASIVSDGDHLRLPSTVAHLPSLHVVVQEEVTGTPLDVLLSTSRAAAATGVEAAAQALAELHRAAASDRQRPVATELHRFRTRAERIGSVDAVAGTVLGHLADRLLDLHDELPASWTGPVHGDCKPSQFLCTGEGVCLMDLDHLGISDQAADIGTFVASLRQLALRGRMSRVPAAQLEGLDALADRFVDSYLRVRGDGRDPIRVRWQEAVALQRKALRAFARAPRSPVALALAAEAGRCLDRMEAA